MGMGIYSSFRDRTRVLETLFISKRLEEDWRENLERGRT